MGIEKNIEELTYMFCNTLQKKCTHEKQYAHKLKSWPDMVASDVRKELKRVSYWSEREAPGSSMQIDTSLKDVTEHEWFAELLRAIASCFTLAHKPSEGEFIQNLFSDVQGQALSNLEGQFNQTQSNSLSKDDWSKRMIESPNEDVFWKESELAIRRFFEYAHRNPQHFIRDKCIEFNFLKLEE